MPATKRLFIRVTKSQFERIKLNAQAKGFVTLSEYIRSLALDKDLCFQSKFNNLYAKVMEESTSPIITERPLTAFI